MKRIFNFSYYFYAHVYFLSFFPKPLWVLRRRPGAGGRKGGWDAILVGRKLGGGGSPDKWQAVWQESWVWELGRKIIQTEASWRWCLLPSISQKNQQPPHSRILNEQFSDEQRMNKSWEKYYPFFFFFLLIKKQNQTNPPGRDDDCDYRNHYFLCYYCIVPPTANGLALWDERGIFHSLLIFFSP